MRNLEENLIGYALNTLDPDECREVDEYLQNHPDAQRQLETIQRAIQPLSWDEGKEYLPPPDLTDRTIHALELDQAATLPMAPVGFTSVGTSVSWWRRSDVLAACFLLIVFGSIGIPWIASSWHRSEIVECQLNLQRLHSSLVKYAEQQPNQQFPQVPQEGPLAFAGAFVPVLHEHGLLNEDVHLGCPNQDHQQQPATRNQLVSWFQNDPEQYQQAVYDMGGSYAYSLGYSQDGRVTPLGLGKDQGRFPLLADCPPFSGGHPSEGMNSRNHAGEGQNVLFVDGHVQFFTIRNVGSQGDDIYLNRHKQVRPGVTMRDSVLGAREVTPFQY